MSTRIGETIFQIGSVPARNFSEDCHEGDWEEFVITFPTPFPKEVNVRVIVTANNLEVERGAQNAAVVGIVRDLTPGGFVLLGRSSDCARGDAGFNWMAVAETPGRDERPIGLRLGVVQPMGFSADCHSGDWQNWGAINFSAAFNEAPVVLLTASNLNVAGHNAAAVGIARDSQPDRFTLVARNSDCADGNCTFYYVALSPRDEGRSDIWVDSGEVSSRFFQSDCKTGDWYSWNIMFNQSFLTPPVVLVTANDLGIREGHNAAVVGIAQNVTTHGFTLAGRNSDCASGQAGFYWVAIGCALGCG